MLRYVVLWVVGLLASGAWAQQAPPQAEAPAAASSPASVHPATAVNRMEEPQPGDHWTYEVRDEITGSVSATRENVVTEVTPTEISVRYKNLGGTNEGLNVYDRSWNVVEDRPWRYSPHDGSGIQTPLAVGKTWPVRTNNINSANGSIWKRSGTSKVVGQESVTTKAGTFDTFKIETTFTGSNVNNPTLKNEVTSLTWYAPAIDHWVRRTFVSRAGKRLQISNTTELIEYGRKR
ncbi:MAG TPA: hypothetical protein VHQ48_06190 [Bradyrhizobium sp.]|jgi:hypothetical protein|nr:hypothetical protein [Bradyrhizobium sp.]